MSPTPEQIRNEEQTAPPVNGDLYDEDTGTYIDSLILEEGLPARLSIFWEGYWYIFTPQTRYKQEADEEEEKVDSPVVEEIKQIGREISEETKREFSDPDKDITAP